MKLLPSTVQRKKKHQLREAQGTACRRKAEPCKTAQVLVLVLKHQARAWEKLGEKSWVLQKGNVLFSESPLSKWLRGCTLPCTLLHGSSVKPQP